MTYAGYTLEQLGALEQAAQPAPWKVEVEEYEQNSGQICLDPWPRLLHDPDWADPEDWERDLANSHMLVAARNALPHLLKDIKHLRGSMAAQDARNLAATERLGWPPYGCDTPDHLADTVEALRLERDSLLPYKDQHVAAIINSKVREQAAEIEHLRQQRDELHAANNQLLEERRTAELVTFLVAKAQWSLATFGPGMRTEGICRHIEKELIEIRAKPFDLVEWVDVFMLAVDGFWRAWWGVREGQQPNRADLEAMAYGFIGIVNDKHAENLQRKWPAPTGEDQPVEHIR